MDSDLVGFSVYGSKTFADIWNVVGDIGYLQISNDVTESGYDFGELSEDVNAFTLVVRGEGLTKPVRSTSFRSWVCATRVSPPTASWQASTPKSTIRTSSRCLSA